MTDGGFDAADLAGGHDGDGYCALCRRCQMRKKLERRLASRRGRSDETGVEAPPAEDHRPINELLSFIGAESASGASGRTPGNRRARRKRAAALRRRAMASTETKRAGAVDDGDAEGDGDGDASPDSSSCFQCSSDDSAAPPPASTGMGTGTVKCQGSKRTPTTLFEYEDLEDEEIDRQVEEFRRLLESAHVKPRHTALLRELSR